VIIINNRKTKTKELNSNHLYIQFQMMTISN